MDWIKDVVRIYVWAPRFNKEQLKKAGGHLKKAGGHLKKAGGHIDQNVSE